ncbi:hypothetical protein D5R93_00135 [Actinomyces lilanjuaniae]|uniref:Uncharacterized protein n=1 Tax=Actinomyces lilanjuaniae TaxID=2321394 RepID=A0ABM6Z0R7_9ACTO|nr:hypothetical protein D5R93_00135 [Actinomyces lilanjuaniae]
MARARAASRGHHAAAPGGRAAAAAGSGGVRAVRAGSVFRVLMLVNLVVAAASATTFYGRYHTQGAVSEFLGLVYEMVTLDAEQGVATWLSSLLWAVIGVVALFYSLAARRFSLSWGFFAAVGLAASLDEYAELHERLRAVGERMQPYLPFQVSYTWVLPGAVIAVVVVAVLARLVLSLPGGARGLLVVAGLIFLTGAVVLETLAGALKDGYGGTAGLLYWSFSQAEELLELTGVSLALSALLSLTAWDPTHHALRVMV